MARPAAATSAAIVSRRALDAGGGGAGSPSIPRASGGVVGGRVLDMDLQTPFVVQHELDGNEEPLAEGARIELRVLAVHAGGGEAACGQGGLEHEPERHRAARLLRDERVARAVAAVAERDLGIAGAQALYSEAVPRDGRLRPEPQAVAQRVRLGAEQAVDERRDDHGGGPGLVRADADAAALGAVQHL